MATNSGVIMNATEQLTNTLAGVTSSLNVGFPSSYSKTNKESNGSNGSQENGFGGQVGSNF